MVYNDEETKQSVVAAVKIAFKRTNGNYDNPTKEELIKIVEFLGNQALVMSTPIKVIKHHKEEIMKVLGHLTS